MNSTNNNNNSSNPSSEILQPAGLVSEQVLEYLLTEVSKYAARACAPETALNNNDNTNSNTNINDNEDNNNNNNDDAALTLAAEMAAAKLERLGYSVGYRWTERLAQNKTWNAAATTNDDPAITTAAQQLEAVKFLCKEVWMEMFRKQIDKLQTNHRGVFVLKDLNLRWLSRFPAGTEESRVSAMRLLAFPCGLIRGALANLGIPAVVSCDFLADGHNMSACSFNLKVK